MGFEPTRDPTAPNGLRDRPNHPATAREAEPFSGGTLQGERNLKSEQMFARRPVTRVRPHQACLSRAGRRASTGCPPAAVRPLVLTCCCSRASPSTPTWAPRPLGAADAAKQGCLQALRLGCPGRLDVKVFNPGQPASDGVIDQDGARGGDRVILLAGSPACRSSPRPGAERGHGPIRSGLREAPSRRRPRGSAARPAWRHRSRGRRTSPRRRSA